MMSTFLVFLAAAATARAADPSTYALSAPVELPATGAVRVTLPPDLVGGNVDTLAQGLLLADATGRAVPYAVLRSSNAGAAETETLFTVPVGDTSWETDAAEAPVDRLALDIDDLAGSGPFRATVEHRAAGAWRAVDERLVYALDSEESRTLDVPHVTGPFRVTLAGYRGVRPRLLGVSALTYAPDHVPPNVETVAMPTPVVTEMGSARYTLRLPGVRTIRALRFSFADDVDVFEREVTIRAVGTELYGNSYASGRLRRLRVGEANVDRLEVPVERLVGDTFVLEIPLERGAPLPLASVDILSEGVRLVTRDAGPGPHTLLGAATVADSAYDLAIALPELLRPEPPIVAVQAPSPNPVFVPVPTREEVDQAGPDLALARFRYERPIEGAGWVRVALGRDVLARTRPDLADVRVVDSAGRQVPFLLWDTDEEEPVTIGEVERREEGRSTLLRIPIDGGAPVATLALTTSRDVFERTVTVLRDAGRSTIPLRQVVWSGPTRGSTLAMEIGDRVGDTLLVRIDNGDDAPLPIDAIVVTAARWEIRTRLPEGGARLVYGAPGASAPEFDLALLSDEVRRMPVASATLGEERTLAAPAPTLLDRGATLAGVAMLAVGLLGMVVRVLRGVSAPAEP